MSHNAVCTSSTMLPRDFDRRDIHRDEKMAMTFAMPRRGLLARGFENPAADRLYEPGFFGRTDEFAEASSPRSGCCQRISASTPIMRARFEVDLRLVVQLEFASSIARLRSCSSVQRRRPVVQLRRVELVVVPPAFLRPVHRGVGVLEQPVGVRAIGRKERDADAGGHPRGIALDLERTHQRGDDLLRDKLGVQ